MLNNNENKAMENGYVVLPVEKYNELLAAQQAASRLITIKPYYTGKYIEAVLDAAAIYRTAVELFNGSMFKGEEYELVLYKDFYVSSPTIAKLITPAAEGEES